VGCGEHTGGGSPAFTNTLPLPLLETATKHEFPQPARHGQAKTAQQLKTAC
jgi:hypothetical protein